MKKEQSAETKPSDRKIPIALIAIAVVVICGVGALLIWQLRKPTSLLPDTLIKQTTNFTPYFYDRQIPAGYSFDASKAEVSDDLLIVPLTKPGAPTVVLTQQPLKDSISMNDLAKNGTPVNDAIAPAVIQNVEGRLVGMMAVAKDKTFILLNAPNNAKKEDMTALLQALTPVQ